MDPRLALNRIILWLSNLTRLRSRTTALALTCLVILIFTLMKICNDHDSLANYTTYWMRPSTPLSPTADRIGHPESSIKSPCHDFPNADNVVVSMKTRAATAQKKIPTHFLTHLQCLPDMLLFSDKEQDIAGHHLHDVFSRISNPVRQQNKVFRLYEDQLGCVGDHENCGLDAAAASKLDKYSVVNMVLRAWELRPNRDWYVFLQDDTYVIWPTLLYWLRERASHNGESYFGSVLMLNGYNFARDGSGFVLSGDVVSRLNDKISNLTEMYDEIAPQMAYKDMLLSKALAEQLDVKIQQAYPLFSGEKPSKVPFGKSHWCHPVFTMAGFTSQDLSAMWEFEKSRNQKGFIQYRDLYHQFFRPHMTYYRRKWDNLAFDTCYISSKDQNKFSSIWRLRQRPESGKNIVERNAHRSAAACAKVCEAEGLDIPAADFNALGTEKERGQFIRERYQKSRASHDSDALSRQCFQWRYEKGLCCTSSTFTLGSPAGWGNGNRDDDKGVTSGWFVKGIEDWVDAMGSCGLEWTEPFFPSQ